MKLLAMALALAAIGWALYRAYWPEWIELVAELKTQRPSQALAAGILILFLIALTGCSTTPAPRAEPIIRTVDKIVKVDDPTCARALMARLGKIPEYPDSDERLQAVTDIFEGVRLLKAGRELRSERERQLVAGLEECAQ